MKLLETFNAGQHNIFYHIYKNKNEDKLAWLTEDNYELLDFEYYLQHSGDKNISLLYQRAFEIYNGDYDITLDQLAKIIINKFEESWEYLYRALYATYNPIENYDGYEDETVKTNTDTSAKSNIKNYGFNSATGKPASDSDSTFKGDAEKNYTNRILHKHGNMGVTTSQQMIESEIELREFVKNFYNLVYNDIDTVLSSLQY